MSSTGELDAGGLPISGAARGQIDAEFFIAEDTSGVLSDPVIPISDDSSHGTGAEFVTDGGVLA